MKIPETDLTPDVAMTVSHMLASAIAALDYVTGDDQAWERFATKASKVIEDDWGNPERTIMREDRDALARMYMRLDHELGHPSYGQEGLDT